jgi:hypothetical protein
MMSSPDLPAGVSQSAPQIQANQYPDFALHTLGWKAFQDLIGVICSDVLGQTFQQFLPSKDAGRDGAFCGTWRMSGNEALAGSFTAQCKFTNKPNATLSPSDLKSEVSKAKKLAARGLATNYLLFTNFGVSGQTDVDLKKQFESIPGIKVFLSYGRDWIVQQILASTRLRMLVPRIYGLGDLSQILDDRQYRQAAEILSSMQQELAKFVITDAYRKSANAILDHGFVFLLGEPASGKSTIAASLALGAIDNWKCSTLKERSAQEFVKHWNPNEPAQFFWIDDVFGPNQYQATWAQAWNSALPHLHAAVQKGTKVLFTSRDYIYRAALRDLKVSAFPLLTESQVVIHVEQLTLPERNQILYNHLKLGSQPTTFKTRIKPFLPTVSRNPKFLPEIARRLADPLFTKKLAMSPASVTYFVEHPLEWLKEVIVTLDAESKAALALIFMAGGALSSPLSLSEPFVENALRLLGGSVAGVRQALSDMNNSLVKNVRSAEAAKWVYKHPTIGDALAEIIAADPELVEIYVRGTPIERITMEAVCGGASVEGAKVVIPRSHYGHLVGALSQLQKEPRLTFLSQRCGEDFLKRYIERTPTLWNDLAAFDKLFGSAEISLAARLQGLHLLPGDVKSTIANRVVELSADWPDSDFLNPEKLRHLFSATEIDVMFHQVIDRLMPDIDQLIDGWDSNFDSSGEEPDSFYTPLLNCLQDFYTWTKDPETERLLKDAISSAEAALEDAHSNYRPPPEPDDDYHDHYDSAATPAEVERDMFDDVDE